jgi:hypothetical protein
MPRMGLALACFAVVLAGCGETFENRYSDRDEAKKAGAFERGWLPEWLPSSATNVREIHNLDTNGIAFSFSAHAGWGPPDTAGCVTPVQTTAPSIRFSGFPLKIEQRPGVLKCGDPFVLPTVGIVFAWR